MIFISRFQKPKGLVKLTMVDNTTGKSEVVSEGRKSPIIEVTDKLLETLFAIKTDRRKFPDFNANTATLTARKISAKLLDPGTASNYKITKVEWGFGFNIPEEARDVKSLSSPYAPRVLTDITSYTYPTADENIIKFTSKLTDTPLLGGPTTPVIREVGLRTNPIAGGASPDDVEGALLARYVNGVDIPKNDSNLSILVDWLFIYN